MADRDPQIAKERSHAASDVQQGKPKKWLRPVLMASLPLALIAGGAAYYLANDHYVSTDNAYVQQDKVSVSAEVNGRIIDVAVRENQTVKAGDLLFRIDPQPYQLAAAQADAAIASAQVRLATLQTDYQTSGVDIASAREDVAFFTKEYERQSKLMQTGFTTKARLQEAEHALSEARSRLSTAQADAQKAQSHLATGAAAPGVNPQVLSAQVQKRRAILELSRTEVRAPESGVVSQADRLQVGQMMVSGLPAVTIVSTAGTWIEANFKETDLNLMRIGQPAELTFDAYPKMKLKGHVASIGAGTGSEFSVLPAQNANGNWVKVTQRVPVRIVIDEKAPRPLIAGLSTHVRIDTAVR
jgi:membrane fusion protein (multidrug efflux system)